MNKRESELPKGEPKPSKPVDVYRAGRQFERFMRGFNSHFKVDAPGEERMTSEEVREDRDNRQFLPDVDHEGWRFIAEIIHRKLPDGTIETEVRRVKRNMVEDSSPQNPKS